MKERNDKKSATAHNLMEIESQILSRLSKWDNRVVSWEKQPQTGNSMLLGHLTMIEKNPMYCGKCPQLTPSFAKLYICIYL